MHAGATTAHSCTHQSSELFRRRVGKSHRDLDLRKEALPRCSAVQTHVGPRYPDAVPQVRGVALDTLELVKSDRVVEFPVSDWGGVSERAKGFLRLCLSKNPSTRPTPDQLLGHSWIQFLKPDFLNVIDAPPPTKRRILGKGFLSRRSRFNRTSGRITMTGSVNVIRHEIV